MSHSLAHTLLKKHRITAKRWIQIWEDPWCLDLVFRSLNTEKAIARARQEEQHLLELAEEILYVSPITLDHQKSTFPTAASKMGWEPVPSYYSDPTPCPMEAEVRFGYFGDYSSQIRNLQPFYQAAKELNVVTNICGGSDKMFDSVGNITVRPRVSLEELKPIEDQTNVLVFLANLRGGQIPGKIYQYAATGKTVLFIADGTEEEKTILKQYFGQFNRFVFCENTPEDIRRTMERILRHELGDVVNRPLDCFSPRTIVSHILGGTVS